MMLVGVIVVIAIICWFIYTMSRSVRAEVTVIEEKVKTEAAKVETEVESTVAPKAEKPKRTRAPKKV